jgi:hypothetical protein
VHAVSRQKRGREERRGEEKRRETKTRRREATREDRGEEGGSICVLDPLLSVHVVILIRNSYSYSCFGWSMCCCCSSSRSSSSRSS